MLTTFYTQGAIDTKPPFFSGNPPDPKNGHYYRALTTYWYITPDSSLSTNTPQVDLDLTCKSGDIITPETLRKSLWFYKQETNELFIPMANAQLIVHELYKIEIPLPVAQAWLRTLEFSERFVKADTCSLYAGVKFEGCEPNATKMARCMVLDMSKPDTQAVTDEEWDDMLAHTDQGDMQYAKPYEWRKRRELKQSNPQYVSQLDHLTAFNPNSAARLVTKRTQASRQAQVLRLAKKYGNNTPEFKQAMEDYDNGVRRPRGRKGEDDQLKQKTQIRVAEYVRKLAHPEINLFCGDLVGARRTGDVRASDAPVVYPASLLAPTRFHTDLVQTDYDVANRPLAWAIHTREVRVPIGESSLNPYHEVRTQVTKVAVVENALAREIANYSQATHYVTTRRERNPVTKQMDTCAVFDIEHMASGKLRAKRSQPQSQLDGLTARLDETATKVAELAAKVDKLGKAFHALMGIIKEMQG